MVSNRTSTLDEINLIVRVKLKREPLKKFESYNDYRDRIFSEKIIEIKTPEIKSEPKQVTFPGYEYLKSIDHTGFEVKNAKKKKVKPKKPKKVVQVYDELESESSESENENESSDEYSDDDTSDEDTSDDDTSNENEPEEEDLYDYEAPDEYESGGEYDYDD